jgi:hypothetical protein
VGSRLAFDNQGRLIAEGTGVELRGLRWLVRGNTVLVSGGGIAWMGPTGRAPTPREMMEARTPYNAPNPLQTQPTDSVRDEEIDDAEAIRQAMIEQRRQPVDLLSAA